MLDLAAPAFTALIARVRNGDAAATGIAVDWLNENAGTLADAVRAYALPPEYERCPKCDVNRLWIGRDNRGTYCTNCDLSLAFIEDDSLRPLLTLFLDQQGDGERTGRVLAWRIRQGGYSENWYVENSLRGWEAAEIHYVESLARRALKRAVLKEFDGDVRVPVAVYQPELVYGDPPLSNVSLLEEVQPPLRLIRDRRSGAEWSMLPEPPGGRYYDWKQGEEFITAYVKPTDLIQSEPQHAFAR